MSAEKAKELGLKPLVKYVRRRYSWLEPNSWVLVQFSLQEKHCNGQI